MTRPNIIFILVDDLGWRDLSCYGSTYYETPNLDHLVSQGMYFSDAYAACPVCSPTRASILTGKYPATLGVTDWIDWEGKTHPCRGKLLDAPYIDHLPLEETTIAEALKKVGYSTWHIGKWHLGKGHFYPNNQGFEINIGGCELGAPVNGYFSPYNIPTLSNGLEGEFLTDRLTDEAINLIMNRGDKPFFLNLWYYCVHTPIQAKEKYIKKFEEKAARLNLKNLNPFEYGEPFPTEHKKNANVTRREFQSDPIYAAMVYSLDENIGRLLKFLEESGEIDNTVIIFTSDNGGLSTAEGSPTCNKPLSEGKGWMYEGGTRVPLIIYWPGVINPNTRCEAAVTSPDFFPTLLELAELNKECDQDIEGESVVPLLRESGSINRDAIFFHYPHYGNQGGTPGSSIRSGDYKLIRFYEDDHEELYNLRDDIGEEANLIEVNPGIADTLRSKLCAWIRSVEGKIPVSNPNYK